MGGKNQERENSPSWMSSLLDMVGHRQMALLEDKDRGRRQEREKEGRREFHVGLKGFKPFDSSRSGGED